MTKVRCAIYTRKSTDEGLQQEFNSLDAQREACLAYVASLRHEGWVALSHCYDDGGFSGGSIDRPGLGALLADVEAGRIDVVVIYKIDRLTRSLADFARIVEVLEKANASFVSVTQSFNTKTSMGRLMLHVLLSFAQFEREVGAERVRDKIAASKAKGMWMGGSVPLGYDAVDRKLVINEEQSATVRAIFHSFVELKSVPALLSWAREQGIARKRRMCAGTAIAGRAFRYGALRHLLSNRIYVGEVCHKGRVYAGQHEPIVDRALFEEVQAILASRGNAKAAGPRLVSESLLKGILFDSSGRRMGPSHTLRKGQRYRYYATHSKTIDDGSPAPLRFAANQLERHCLTALAGHLQQTLTASAEAALDAERIAAVLREGPAADQHTCFKNHVAKVTAGEGLLVLKLVSGTRIEHSIAKLRHGNDVELLIGEKVQERHAPADMQLLKLLGDALRARALALRKPSASLGELAREFGRSAERFKRLIRLSYLAPSIVEAVHRGEQPSSLTSVRLQHLDGLPIEWSRQELLLLR